MRLALALAVIGVALALVAAVGLLNTSSEVGDATAVEETLTPPSDPLPTTTSPADTTITSIAPLWSPNERSLITDLDVTQEPKPERLRIDVLDIDAPVGEYGVAPSGQMDVPDNVTEAGWYKHGPSPGEAGSAVLAAHVDLRGPGRGLFYDLDELEVDDEVVVGYSDGESRRFRVLARSTYLKSELPLDVIFSREGDPVLTLITCGGGFSASEGSYDSNVVVYAVPVEAEDGAGLPAS